MAVTDYAGTWEYKGTIIPKLSIPPNFYQWLRFPSSTTGGNSNCRLTYYGDFSKIKTFGYLRVVYDMGDLVYGAWRRIYPKAEKELLDLNVPEEILINSAAIPRYFEITKVYKPSWRRYGSVLDESWSVAIECLEQAALPAAIYDLLASSPQKVINVGNSGNIVIVLEGQGEN